MRSLLFLVWVLALPALAEEQITLRVPSGDQGTHTVNGKAVLARGRTAEGNFPVGAEVLTEQDDGRRLIFRNMGTPQAPIWKEVGSQSGPGAPLVYQ